MPSRVIHTAQALVDVVVEVPTLPRRGANVMATGHDRYAAGAVNILLAGARSGAECVHAGAHGEGPNGDLVRSALAAEGVSLSAPMTTGQDTGICVVLLEASAERTFVTTQMAEREITVESLATSAPVAGDLVCVSGYSLIGRTRDPLLTWLGSLDPEVVVVLDPGAIFAELDERVQERMLTLTDVWTSNMEEGEDLTGESDMIAAAAASLAYLPPGAVSIIRDGAKGCALAVPGEEAVVVEGFPEKAIDTNGAGDTHTGVLAAEWAKGTGWVEACRRANAAGAIKVTRRGPDAAPTVAEIDHYLR
ncbi:bifunctional hydroxymethylpyrimidine kinase/phosphomethylpyrimidine kinase [Janibacter sp. YIM B02568]|uniref:PfkB family carbohydrate kinase n=1 Tax=Janibacter endophyticus TaxID=2806261 RepID=UPI00194DFCE4|nr:PfkB family carbohydrate kinase [Janibacter endophyticus]MBM6546965.1 bifunctional hydroxymethylpyrimidine kinase/phosphomethylpyrimidine kinase [Janibacter endophyticus]